MNRRTFVASLACLPFVGGLAAIASTHTQAQLTWDDINELARKDADWYLIVHANQEDYNRLKPLTPDPDTSQPTAKLLGSPEKQTSAYTLRVHSIIHDEWSYTMIEYVWRGRWVRVTNLPNDPQPM